MKNIMDIKDELKELEQKVSLGLKEAYRKLVVFKKKNNSPLIVSRDGKVIAIAPKDIPLTTSSKN